MAGGMLQLAAQGDQVIDALLWCSVLMGGVMALGAVMLAARWLCLKWLRKPPPAEFPFEDVERLRASGELSQEEFRRIRLAALGMKARGEEKDERESSAPEKLDDGTIGAGGNCRPRDDEEHS